MPFDLPFSRQAAAAPALPLAHVLGALSHALDLTEGQPAGHCVRSCWIGVHVARRMGLEEAAIADLYYAILLKDLGCSSNAARVAQLYLTDDLQFKRDSKFLGDASGPALRFILDHTGQGCGLVERLRTTFKVIRYAGEIVQELIETRCERGAGIAHQLRFTHAVSDGIRSLDEHWNGGGRPLGLRGRAIPLFSRIALLAQVADVFFTSGGMMAACDEVRARTGAWFDPEVAAAFHGVAEDPRFWTMLASDDIGQAVLDLEPAQRMVAADDSYLDDIATAFAQVVDAKSPFTSGHSLRVARFTELLGQRLGLDAAALQRLKRAALLHDVGKLGVSNSILDKPGKLDAAEWAAMRQHPAHSGTILSRIGCFGELADVGAGHHERLDGKGYPFGLDASQIGMATRIVTTADVCDALSATRPYREAMPIKQMLDVMGADVGTAFDPVCFDALRDLAAERDLLAVG
jgi:HD-GYP domain-containing protein (c-di-GMP phosphodiesterase class II)